MTRALERAARAICLDMEEDPDATDTPYAIQGWRLYANTARAALAAALSGDEMVEAMAEAVWPGAFMDTQGWPETSVRLQAQIKKETLEQMRAALRAQRAVLGIAE